MGEKEEGASSASLSLCVWCMAGLISEWRGISWGKVSSSHFGIKPDQSPGELVKVNCCQKGLDHLGLFRMPVGLLAFSGYANWKLLVFTGTSIKSETRVNGTWRSPFLLLCSSTAKFFGGINKGKRFYNLNVVVPFSQAIRRKYVLYV